jgi:hypothetical protein
MSGMAVVVASVTIDAVTGTSAMQWFIVPLLTTSFLWSSRAGPWGNVPLIGYPPTEACRHSSLLILVALAAASE